MADFSFVLLLFALKVFVAADPCSDNSTVKDLPGGVLAEDLSILTSGTISIFQDCQDGYTIENDNIKFGFYSRSTGTEPVFLDPNNPSHIDPEKPIKILIHGWLCNKMLPVKDAYLVASDVNVIVVDWVKYSYGLYGNAFCYAPKVAELVAALLCKSKDLLKVDPSNIQVVGHSVGGQMAGLVGQEVQDQCGEKIGRITGLDPAGPLYQLQPASRRLDSSDAAFVDVMHTSDLMLGYSGACGHVDFYPNCGTFQPGCTVINFADINALMNLQTDAAICSHMRSIDYMVESINPGANKFVATSCFLCPSVCVKDILFPSTTLMGQDCPTNPPAKKFVVYTNSAPPFATGH